MSAHNAGRIKHWYQIKESDRDIYTNAARWRCRHDQSTPNFSDRPTPERGRREQLISLVAKKTYANYLLVCQHVSTTCACTL